MAMNEDKREALATRVDAIEDCYEFMLAYAAQGREADSAATGSGSQVRGFLERADQALDGIGTAVVACFSEIEGMNADSFRPFVKLLEADARGAHAAFHLVLSQPAISSQLIDNLNASIHVRTLLTDMFLIDETLKIAARVARKK